MSNIKKSSVVSALIAPLALAAGASAEDEPRRTITEIADGVYRATGHGPVGTVDDITDWRLYFEALEGAIDAGQSLEEMQQSIEIPEYSHWNGYNWLDLNVLGMYHFLTD